MTDPPSPSTRGREIARNKEHWSFFPSPQHPAASTFALQHMGWFASIVLANRRPARAVGEGAPSDGALSTPAPSEPCTPPGPRGSCAEDWPSGKFEFSVARYNTTWPDGEPVGRGFPQPYLEAQYAVAVADGRKTVEGRPGGGWMKSGVQPNDYIRFKIPRRPGRSLIVIIPRATMSSEHCCSSPCGPMWRSNVAPCYPQPKEPRSLLP